MYKFIREHLCMMYSFRGREGAHILFREIRVILSVALPSTAGGLPSDLMEREAAQWLLTPISFRPAS